VARSSVGLVAFNGGELSPEVEGRTDLAKYNQGARLMLNYIPHPEGGMFRRPGFRFVSEVHDSTRRTRLLPFIFSTSQAYALEFCHQRIRVYRNEGILVSPDHSFGTSAVFATENEIAITDHGYYDGQRIHIDSDQSPADLPDPLAEATDYFVKLPNARTFTDGDVAPGTEEITITGHGYSANMGPFELVTNVGVLPGGLRGHRNQTNVQYYILVVDPDTIQLSLTKGGAAVNITDVGGAGSVNTLRPKPDYARDTFRLAATLGGAAIDITDQGTGTHTALPQPRHAMLVQSTEPLQIVSAYTESELFDIQYVQSGDVLYLVHPSHPTRKLSRMSHTGWALDEIAFIDGPFEAINTTNTTATLTFTTSGRQTVTFSSTEGVNNGAGFTANDIGRLFRALGAETSGGTDDRNWMWGVIIGVATTTSIDVEFINGTGDGGVSPTPLWRLGFFYTGSYPKAVQFTEQRLCFAGEANTPQTLHMSKTSDFETFSPTGQRALNTRPALLSVDTEQLKNEVLDDNAIDYTVSANLVNAIDWMVSGRNLILGTAGAIIPVRATAASDAITPTNIRLTPSRVSGGNGVQAIALQDRMIFVSRNSRAILGLRFSFDTDDFVADDLTLLSDHMLGVGSSALVGVVELAYQSERHSILWMPRKDGQLIGITYQPDQEVFAWHRHILGGSFQGGIAQVESATTIPSPGNTYDQLWVVVKRTINGATRRFVEFMLPDWSLDSMTLTQTVPAEPEAIYVDSSPIPYVGAATSSITGLDHLEGETVGVMADGGAHADATVASGAIALQQPHTEVVAGLGYVSDWESMAIEIPDPAGTSAGKRRRIDHTLLRLLASIGGEIGPDADHLDPIVTRTGADVMDSGPPPFTGIHRQATRHGYAEEARVFLRQAQPLPLNLLAINLIVEGGQR
jgi:hypothetical protein